MAERLCRVVSAPLDCVYNSRFRDEFLNTELFATVAEAQVLVDRWRWEYNTLRPLSALKGRTPLEAAQPAVA